MPPAVKTGSSCPRPTLSITARDHVDRAHGASRIADIIDSRRNGKGYGKDQQRTHADLD